MTIIDVTITINKATTTTTAVTIVSYYNKPNLLGEKLIQM